MGKKPKGDDASTLPQVEEKPLLIVGSKNRDQRVVTINATCAGVNCKMTFTSDPGNFEDEDAIPECIRECFLGLASVWEFQVVPVNTPDSFVLHRKEKNMLEKEDADDGDDGDDIILYSSHSKGSLGLVTVNFYIKPTNPDEVPEKLKVKHLHLTLKPGKQENVPPSKRPEGQTGLEDFADEKNGNDNQKNDAVDVEDDFKPRIQDNREPGP